MSDLRAEARALGEDARAVIEALCEGRARLVQAHDRVATILRAVDRQLPEASWDDFVRAIRGNP